MYLYRDVYIYIYIYIYEIEVADDSPVCFSLSEHIYRHIFMLNRDMYYICIYIPYSTTVIGFSAYNYFKLNARPVLQVGSGGVPCEG